MVSIKLNGSEVTLAVGTTIAALLRDRGLDRPGIAVAIDRRVIPRSRHEQVEVRDGEAVEVIGAVGGG